MSKSAIDTIMEKSVIPSFSSLGSSIRSRLFNWQTLSSYSLTGKVVVITGATSGIGEAGARHYAQLGATLVIVARSAEKVEALTAKLQKETGNNQVFSVIADLGDQDEVRKAAAELALRWPVINVLVHNAGALFNKRKRAANGTDLSVELMVATPFLLTGLLLRNLEAAAQQQDESTGMTPAAARVLTMSSGGMYTQPLKVDALQMSEESYQGAQQYALAKRAQVILNQMWATRVPADKVVFHALHPGWVSTPGITEALPGFSRILGPLGLLRSADMGADTMVWLSADEQAMNSSGKFWHDRQARNIDMSNNTRNADTPTKRQALWQWCEKHTNWSFTP